MRLHRVDADDLDIARRRRGTGFSYVESDGARVSADIRARIEDLVIPPAWQDVKIARDPAAHIQAYGVDAAGRRQYIYHPDWVQHRSDEKFDRVRTLADSLPALRKEVRGGLSGRGATEERVTCAALRVLDLGAFRIGNDVYLEDNGSHGLSTLLRSHVTVIDDGLRFRYRAKGGIDRDHELAAPDLVPVVRSMRRAPAGGRFLVYRDRSGWHDLRADRVNEALKEMVGDDFTAKDRGRGTRVSMPRLHWPPRTARDPVRAG